MKLYEITEQYRGLMEMDIPEEALIDTLEAINAEFDNKAIAVGHVIKNLQGDITALDAEIKRLSDRKSARDNRIKYLKSYVLGNMGALDKKKIECDLFTFSRRKGHMKVFIDDGAQIPNRFTKVVVTPDKTALKKAIESGHKFEGISMARGQDSLVMR